MRQALCAVCAPTIVGVVAQNHTPKPLRIPFNSNTTPGLSSDIDGPWPTVHLTYGPDSLGLDCYLTLWNHSIFVPEQSCVHVVDDPIATDSQPGPKSTEVQPFPCNLTMPLFYKPSHPFDDNSSKMFNFSDYESDELWEETQSLFGPLNITGTAKWTLDTLAGFGSNQTLPDASILVATNLTHHFSGTSNRSSFLTLPLLFPLLSLWGNNMTDINGRVNPIGEANPSGVNLLPYLFEAAMIPSRSFGMHMGSVDPYVAGSLILGGYDRSRILGPLLVYDSDSFETSLSLINLGIGVEEGYIPLDQLIESDGSYLQGPAVRPLIVPEEDINGQINTIITLDPGVPYMYLPRSWCDAIASKLDLSYDGGRNLYIWGNLTVLNALLKSTSFLVFEFGSINHTDQLVAVAIPSVITNVSFALLSKTFSVSGPPANVDSPAAGSKYFPCSPFPDGGIEGLRSPVLGRSFLQSAFFGMNFHTGQSMLAQAPGPTNLADGDVVTIGPLTRMVSMLNTSAPGAWTESWAGVLPIASVNADGSLLGFQTKHSVSERGKRSIAASLGTVLIISMVVAWVILMRRHRRHKRVTGLQMLEEDALARDYERLRLEQIHRTHGRNGQSEDTEREEEDCLLPASEVESDPANNSEEERGHEDRIQPILC